MELCHKNREKKVLRSRSSLRVQLAQEANQILGYQPHLRRVLLADDAEPNWGILTEVDQACGPAAQPGVEIVDFYHACDHLKEGCDAAWSESTPRGKAEFERLKILLKQSGMAWSRSGGQAILTLRSLIQSDHWDAAWQLLRMDFQRTVTVLNGTAPNRKVLPLAA